MENLEELKSILDEIVINLQRLDIAAVELKRQSSQLSDKSSTALETNKANAAGYTAIRKRIGALR
jgi:hypothetical protein